MDALQLDQLRLAVRSPDRTAVEGDDRAPLPAVHVKIDRLAALIRQANVRKDLSDPRASLAVVDVGGHFTLVNLAPAHGIPRVSAAMARARTKLPLARDLAFRVRPVGAVALAPALVATRPAIGDPAVAMPHHVLWRQLMTTLALLYGLAVLAGSAGADAKVVEVHASGGPTHALDPRRGRQGAAARLIEPSPCCRHRGPRAPQAAAARIAEDRLVSVHQDRQPHGQHGMQPPAVRRLGYAARTVGGGRWPACVAIAAGPAARTRRRSRRRQNRSRSDPN